MRYYFAPLEGLTDSIYRQAHHKYFPGITRYYTPFFSPTVHRVLTPREQRELPLADSLDFTVIPQVLTKNAEDFLWMAHQCADRGYTEVNLNLGCPSGTVTAKGKGAGMLSDPDALDRFLEDIFAASPLDISVKTRIGFHFSQEWPALLEIYNRYPIKELTVHPRVRTAFYHDKVEMEAFRYAVDNSAAPVCYNGNLCTTSQIHAFRHEYPSVDAVMLGRGLIGDPGMLTPGGSRNAMFRLKENWYYLLCRFRGSEKLGKRLRKTTDLNEYKAITAEIFHTLPLSDELEPCW